MDREVLEFVVEKTKELMASPTCSVEAMTAAKSWLEAIGTERETEETQKYVAELEEDIVTVEGLIAFAESEAGVRVFGADKAKEVATHARELKAAGVPYCDCPACAAVEAILKKKVLLLK